MLSRVLPVAASAVLLLSLSACGSGADSASSSAGSAGTAGNSDSAGSPGSSAASPSAGASGSSAASGDTCEYPTDPNGPAKPVDPPPSSPKYSGTVDATITTSVGDLKLTLDADKAPCTVNSFLSLAQQGFYDDSSCHRLGDTPGFQVLQCGDPTGTGMGGPGYTIPDEFTGNETYPAGTLAMANTGHPNSGGSQFFLVYGDTQLQPQYTIFGRFDDASIKILQKVAKAGTDNSEQQGVGHPNKQVTFEKVTID